MNDLRRRRVVFAGHTGDTAAARTATSDPDDRVRASAYGALSRAGALTSDELRRALADQSPRVRRRAATLAAHRSDVPLEPLLDDPCTEVVETAAWACGERGHSNPTVVTRLATLATQHDDPLVREAAVAALGTLGAPDGLPAILAATGDRVAVRRRAVLALAPFDGEEVQEALRRAAEDRDWQVRDAARILTTTPEDPETPTPSRQDNLPETPVP